MGELKAKLRLLREVENGKKVGGNIIHGNTMRYKDACIRDMKAVDIDTMSWEGRAADRTNWRSALKQHLKAGEDKLTDDCSS